MKITTPLVDIKDQLIIFISEGYAVVAYGFQFLDSYGQIRDKELEWSNRVTAYLSATFPTQKEEGQFRYTTYPPMTYTHMDNRVADVVNRVNNQVRVLELILDKLTAYYQFEPDTKRLYVESIDSFEKVRGINYNQVTPFLKNGYLERSEREIKEALALIIGQNYVPKDWAGETDDIYTSQVLLNGQRVQTSIILKGKGTVKDNETHLGHLGKNGDQIERMMREHHSTLYIVQSVKPIGRDIVSSMEVHIESQRSKGNHCYYCLIEGQDTATIMFAYGFLK